MLLYRNPTLQSFAPPSLWCPTIPPIRKLDILITPIAHFHVCCFGSLMTGIDSAKRRKLYLYQVRPLLVHSDLNKLSLQLLDKISLYCVTVLFAGLILSLLMAVFLVFDTKNENQFLLIIYTILSGVVSLWSVIVNARPLDSRFCYDNAIAFTQVPYASFSNITILTVSLFMHRTSLRKMATACALCKQD